MSWFSAARSLSHFLLKAHRCPFLKVINDHEKLFKKKINIYQKGKSMLPVAFISSSVFSFTIHLLHRRHCRFQQSFLPLLNVKVFPATFMLISIDHQEQEEEEAKRLQEKLGSISFLDKLNLSN